MMDHRSDAFQDKKAKKQNVFVIGKNYFSRFASA